MTNNTDNNQAPAASLKDKILDIEITQGEQAAGYTAHFSPKVDDLVENYFFIATGDTHALTKALTTAFNHLDSNSVQKVDRESWVAHVDLPIASEQNSKTRSYRVNYRLQP